MYKLEQEVYYKGEKMRVVGKTEVLGEETVDTLKTMKVAWSLIPESEITLTAPDVFTQKEIVDVWRSTEMLGKLSFAGIVPDLHFFVELCIKSKGLS